MTETRPSVNIFQQQQQDVQKESIVYTILESAPFQIVITILTLYALFGDDIRVMGFRKDGDIVFDGITIVCLIMFSLEIIMSVICKDGYFLSFFFYLDTISTISLLLDIGMFQEAVGLSGNTNGASNTASLARAGRASRVGTKAGRVVRLVRLIRLVKLYKTAQDAKEDKVGQLLEQRRHKRKLNAVAPSTQQQKKPGEGDEEVETAESKVSKMLSDLTTKKVIILVLLLLFLIPLFATDYYVQLPTSMQIQTEVFTMLAESGKLNEKELDTSYKQIITDHEGLNTPIVYLNTPFEFGGYFIKFQDSDYDLLRVDEQDVGSTTVDIEKVIASNSDNDLTDNFSPAFIEYLRSPDTTKDIVGVLSKRQPQQLTALLSLIRTIFVSAVLTFGALMFSKDSNDLALRPIERMIQKINLIAQDPSIAIEQSMEKHAETNETVKIENTIIKIGTLLQLGFGEAGTEIIKMNMARQGDVDPMIQGMKKVAIYGFCDIRNFTDATEVLQEDVMVFVNNIGDIVHTMVDRYLGTANKNIGDAFLLVWKVKPDAYTLDGDNVTWHDRKHITDLADCALLSFMKIQAKINREPKLLAYRKDIRLQSRMDNYKVKIGYGLHMGWGIEGAIGSNFKIDASYLSPNVNMASRLEAATKQYGVPLLISESMTDIFSPGMMHYVRQIDKVTVKGSIEPIGFFTVDMNVDILPPSSDPLIKYQDLPKDSVRMILRQKKLDLKMLVDTNNFDAAQHLQDNKDLSKIMSTFDKEFNNAFGLGFQKYLSGEWKEAQKLFEQSSKLKANDGPTETLLSHMKETNFQKPSDWKGYRELNEK